MTDKLFSTINKVSENLMADVFLYSGEIDRPYDDLFMDECSKNKCSNNVLLLLTTNGGNPDAAYRMGRYLQRKYTDGKVILYIDTICKSAGTLLALCADEIIMSDRAELGPLDVQISEKDELGEIRSGLIPTQALQTLRSESLELFLEHFLALRFRSKMQITTRSAAQIAGTLTVGLFAPIYEQIDPMRLGEIHRAMQMAYEYGSRLQSDNPKKDTLNILVASYPSHNFVIDYKEARELFNTVRLPDEYEAMLGVECRSINHKFLQEDRPVILPLSQMSAEWALRNIKQGDDSCETHRERINEGTTEVRAGIPDSERESSARSLEGAEGENSAQSIEQSAPEDAAATADSDL